MVWALLALGLVAGCGSDGGGGGGGDEEDAGDDVDAGKPDGGEIDADLNIDSSGPCIPRGCSEFEEELGITEQLSCGDVPDGCGGFVQCGSCTEEYQTCGGGGTANVCGCTTRSCEEQSSAAGAQVCGEVGDGCGGELNCGDTCQGQHESCGGGGTLNLCGCAPNPLACGTRQCGTADDGCGGVIQCGTLNGQCSDARQCVNDATCECKTITPDSPLCDGKCGLQVADGCTFDCGNDDPACSNTCPSQGACTSCACPTGPQPGAADDQVCIGGTCCQPEASAVTCGAAQCGIKLNNCGQPVACGTCSAGNACYQDRCIDERKVAMVGDYATRNESFAWITLVNRAARTESISRVRVTLNAQDELEYSDVSCGVEGFESGSTRRVAFISPETSEKMPARTGKLAIPSPVAGLPGNPVWFREKHDPAQDALGWRRGRPSYCPLPTAENPLPSPDPSLPGYAPSPDPYAMGAQKPWLPAGTVCNCPEREIEMRPVCRSGTAEAQAACKASWATETLPYAGENVADSTVTDCRVIDEDQDGKPAVTLEASAIGQSAIARSATVSSVRFWGQVDLVNRRHTGVSEDQPGSGNSVVSCQPTTFLGALLCGASVGQFCKAYVAGERSNTLEFVPLDNTEWSCKRIWDNRAGLFGTGLPPYPATLGSCTSGN